MQRNDQGHLDNLISLYIKWEATETTLEAFRAYLHEHQAEENFSQPLREFISFINSSAGNHPFKFKHTKLFLDVIYVSESVAFRQLNLLLGSFLPQPEKQPIVKKIQNFTSDTYSNVARLSRALIKFIYENPIKSLLLFVGILMLINSIKPPAHITPQQENEPNDEPKPSGNTNLQLLTNLKQAHNYSQCLPWVEPQIDDCNTLVSRQKTIRVCFSTGPNLGDQSSAVSIMDRFRKLGFKGKFELIYHADVRDRVIILFNLAVDFPDIHESPEMGITFYELSAYESFLKQNSQRVDLGFSVGKSGIICDAESINVNSFITFNPYFHAEGGWHGVTDIGLFSGREIRQPNSGSKYYIFDIPTYAQTKDVLLNTPGGRKVMLAKPALSTFLQGMENNKFNVFPIYGRKLRFIQDFELVKVKVGEEHQIYKSMNKPNFDLLSESPSNILLTIAGARYAQLNGPAELQKPLIITVYHDFTANAETVMQLIKQDHWGKFEEPGADKARNVIRKLELDKALITTNITDPKAITIMDNLKPGQILLLSMGRFPKNIFEGLFSHAAENIWPQVREGAGTFNSLIQSGRPHFECGEGPISDAAVFSEQNTDLASSLRALYASETGYCMGMAAWETNIAKLLGLLIIESQKKNSEFNKLFQTFKSETSKPENDRILYALDGVAKCYGR